MRRKYLFAGQVLLLLLVAATLYFQGHRLGRLSAPLRLPSSKASDEQSGVLSAENITRYVDSIADPASEVLPRLQCPELAQSSRYDRLRPASASASAPAAAAARPPVDYFFAIDLRETLPLLPRLLGSVLEVIRFLGPARCALSIVEGNSRDGTREVLEALRPTLDRLHVPYHLRSSDIDPQQGNRVAKLADLRNLALQPLLDEAAAARTAADATVVFLNDVAACAEDILELVYQRQVLGADMVCPMDWTFVGKDPTFYDVWVARGLNGDSFFEIPADGNWNSAWNLFWNNDAARARLAAHRPFQVFSCWNGAAVFAAKPVVDRAVRFRGPRAGECEQGEPQLFCKDLWFHGYGKIAVVPSVNLEYSDGQAKKIKDLKGYTSRWTAADTGDDDRVEWQSEPPALVKCIPSYDTQSFRPWNETLGRDVQ